MIIGARGLLSSSPALLDSGIQLSASFHFFLNFKFLFLVGIKKRKWKCYWKIFWRSEKTKLGSMVSAALVSTLLGLAASNLGIIPYEAKAYAVFLEFLLPLSIPLLLFRADLRRIVQSTGILLLAFLLGSGNITCCSNHILNYFIIIHLILYIKLLFRY